MGFQAFIYSIGEKIPLKDKSVCNGKAVGFSGILEGVSQILLISFKTFFNNKNKGEG